MNNKQCKTVLCRKVAAGFDNIQMERYERFKRSRIRNPSMKKACCCCCLLYTIISIHAKHDSSLTFVTSIHAQKYRSQQDKAVLHTLHYHGIQDGAVYVAILCMLLMPEQTHQPPLLCS